MKWWKTFFSLKNKSFIVSTGIVFWLVYVSIGAIQTYDNFDAYVDLEFKKAVKRLEFVMNSSQQPLISENFDALKETANDAFQKGLIDFYVLQDANSVKMWNYRGIDPQLLQEKFQSYDNVMVTKEYAFKVVQVMDYTYVVGIRFVRSEWMMASFKSIAVRYFFDLFLVTSALVLIVWIMLKDIVSLSKLLTTGGQKDFDKIQASSKEAKVLLSAATGYQTANSNLTTKNTTYEGSLGPAIVEEINSGKDAPYLFESSMVRVDLNGYTQIFLNKKEEYITSILNNYFTRASEIIERYNGLIYQYVGDEIVFHVKGGVNVSPKLALACVRALFDEANLIESQLDEDSGHFFKLKSSIAYSPIRFIKLDRSYALTGVSLIESARFLSHIDDKTKNSVIIDAASKETTQFLCVDYTSEEINLKGFEGLRKVLKINNFISARDIIETGVFDELKFYRTDNDIKEIFLYLKQSTYNEVSYFEIVKSFSSYRIRTHDNQIKTFYFDVLKNLVERNGATRASDRMLASWISLSPRFLSQLPFTEVELKVFKSLLYHSDARVQANVIIAMGELGCDISFANPFTKSKNNRVSADALYVSGKANLTQEVADQLIVYANSKNPLFKASSYWVMNQLVAYYEKQDQVFAATNPHLKKIKSCLESDESQTNKAA